MMLIESDKAFKLVHQRCNCLVPLIMNCGTGDETAESRLRSAFYKFMITTCSEFHPGYDDNDIITNLDDALSMLDHKLTDTEEPDKSKVDHFVVDEGGSPFLEVSISVYGAPVLSGRFSVPSMRALHAKRVLQLKPASSQQA